MNLVPELGKTGFRTCLRGGPVPLPVGVRDTQTKRYIHASFNREDMGWRYARFLFGGAPAPSPWAGRFFGMKMLVGCFGRLTGCVNRGGFCAGLGPLPAEDSLGTGARRDSISLCGC